MGASARPRRRGAQTRRRRSSFVLWRPKPSKISADRTAPKGVLRQLLTSTRLRPSQKGAGLGRGITSSLAGGRRLAAGPKQSTTRGALSVVCASSCFVRLWRRTMAARRAGRDLATPICHQFVRPESERRERPADARNLSNNRHRWHRRRWRPTNGPRRRGRRFRLRPAFVMRPPARKLVSLFHCCCLTRERFVCIRPIESSRQLAEAPRLNGAGRRADWPSETRIGRAAAGRGQRHSRPRVIIST
jgi:hypothetical protein